MNSDEKNVIDYYNTRESKRGYLLLLKGTKHFGYYAAEDRPWHFQKALRQMECQLANTLALPEGSKVLDAGCGMGDVACYLAKNYKLNVEGIDILDFNIDEARKRIKQRGLQGLANVQEMSYAHLQFSDDNFDGVYTMETFVHARDPERVLKEFYRVLKPGGKIVMFEYSHDTDINMSKRAIRSLKKINDLAAMPGFQKFNHGVQEKLMYGVGFEGVQVRDITQNMLPMLKAFAYLAYVPYKALVLARQEHKYVNAMSAVELWRYSKHFRYNVFTATKPKT